LRLLGQSKWGSWVDGTNERHTKAILTDGYTVGDNVLYLWEKGMKERKLLYGKPLEDRAEGEAVPLNGIHASQFVEDDAAVLFVTNLFEDTGGLATFPLMSPKEVTPVPVRGTVHEGKGELNGLEHLDGGRYGLAYNIDGCSWLYEATYDAAAKEMRIESVVCGKDGLANGVIASDRFDATRKRFAISFSTATSPTQIYTVEGKDRKLVRHTRERVLGIPEDWMSLGEDASYESFDGTRVSARLYLPAPALGFQGPRPLVFYVHGGPQSQERPDFAWFSMPLIQFLTMNGFAVFVPNVRGSTGYGLTYTKQVDRDWGGQDRLDHVHAMTKVLPNDGRIDVSRTGVVGRSYGGYMSLTLAARHPELWSAAVDMFGPYNLLTFMERIPETWKPYFAIAVGDPAKDRDFLVERSPQTYMEDLRCPLLVIQGRNDPRVVEQESRDVVGGLRAKGKDVDFLVFEDEGHDVLKFKNRVRCYDAITEFFAKHLNA
ncbi:MAG: S9 family peptidase, partial [Euryarchaeota archaeon]|nr:S9 family peptidase [Euryarchaeota archaeon]